MAKYLLKRLAFGIFSIVAVVAIVMVMVYSLMDRNLIFANDSTYSKMSNNNKITYKYSKWEEYGYLDYVSYADYINELVAKGDEIVSCFSHFRGGRCFRFHRIVVICRFRGVFVYLFVSFFVSCMQM